MRLSTVPERDDAAAIDVLHAALDAGVRLLDTADAYAHHAKDVGHNERLIARALQSWGGDASGVTVATKGGLTRPAGRWVPDGRAKHLRSACEASLRNLGVSQLDLYQLHVVDPKVALKTSVRALAKLHKDGLVRRIGLCNVSVAQIEEARAYADVAAVQVALDPWEDAAVRGGVASYCVEHGIELLAYRPLGGVKGRRRLGNDATVRAIAAKHGTTPAHVVLAWLRSLGDVIRPLPGPTRVDTARACGESIALDEEDIARLDAAFPAADILRRPQAERRPPDDADGEVVIVMGYPGAGKSTAARRYVERGYARLNRDTEGGTLSGLVPKLDVALAEGARRVVLDNTYAARAKRNEVVETAWRHGVPVRCAWLETTIEQARVNAVHRMLDMYGHLLEPEEIEAAARTDPNTFAPRAQLNYQRDLEPPVPAEGFVAVERVELVPRAAGPGKLMLIDVDNVEVGEVEDGWSVAGYAWRPEAAEAAAGGEYPFAVHVCRHGAGPPVCWCRPPMPGLVVLALREAKADPSASLLVGSTPHAARFAAACGLRYAAADDVFGS